MLVLITDGSEENEDIEQALNMLKQEGVCVITVGFSSWSNNENLRHWSSNSQVLQTTDYMGLNQVMQDFVKAACSDNGKLSSEMLFVSLFINNSGII